MTLVVTRVADFAEKFPHKTKDGVAFMTHKVALTLLPIVGKSDLPLGIDYSMWIPVSNTLVLSLARALCSNNAFDMATDENFDESIRLALMNPDSDFELGKVIDKVDKNGVTHHNQTIWVRKDVESDWGLGAMPVSKIAGNISALSRLVGVRKTEAVFAETPVTSIAESF